MDGRKINEKRFRIPLSLLRIALPIYVEKVSITYKLYRGFVLASLWSVWVSTIVDSIVHKDDLNRIMNTFRIIIGSSDFLWSVTYISIFPDTFDRLLSFTEQFFWEEMPSKDAVTGETTTAGWITIILVATRYSTIGIFIIYLGLSTIRILNNELVLNSWYPFDTTTSPTYELVNLFQIAVVYFIIRVYCGIVGLYITIMLIACTQLDKIRISLLNMKQNQDMQQQLCLNIRHHQLILEYMDEIENSLSVFLLGKMSILFIGVCLVAFSAVTAWGQFGDVFEAFAGYLMIMSNIFVLCWFGTKLTEKAESIRHAAWSCDWIGTPISFQKSIMFIIARTNKDFAITAGKFVPLSNVTLLNIMNESLSFFMFLLHVKDRNEDMENHQV